MPVDPDIRVTIDRFLVAVYQHAHKSAYAEETATDALATELGIPGALAEKLAVFLESEGLVDYDNQAVDITVEGILKAEAILRAPSSENKPAPDNKQH